MEYINTTDDGFVTQMANLSAKAPTVQATIGLTPADITAISADYTAMQTAVIDLTAKQTAAQSATQSKKTTRAGVEKWLRALVKRIKANANYTPAIGELLGIVAADSGGSGTGVRALASQTNVRPQLKGSVVGDGECIIKFAKKSFTGVMVYCRRGAEQQFTLLSKQLTSPVVDDRVNLTGGVPETREYKSQFFRNDTPVGQMSDILVLTVPASGMGNATTLKIAA